MYNIYIIPTFLFVKQNIEIDRVSGFNRGNFKNIIEKYTLSPNISAESLNDFAKSPSSSPSRNQHRITTTFNMSNDQILKEINKLRFEIKDFYFEAQKNLLCGLHALNNALQYRLITKEEIFQSAKELKMDSDKLLYLEKNYYYNDNGNFNIHVLEHVLNKKGIALERFKFIDHFPVGMYVINIPLQAGNHYFAVRRYALDLPVWKLDSLSSPSIIEDFTSYYGNADIFLLKIIDINKLKK